MNSTSAPPQVPVRKALISVSDKQGLREFAQGLHALGIEITSTGGTRAFLREQGIPVREISAYTGFPEMMHGRLKTLHPKVFGGILARHDLDEDQQALREHGIDLFELVVVNLYPFAATVARPDTTEAQAVEQVDIGGPSLIRAAAKNHRFTSVVTSSCQYGEVLEELRRSGEIPFPLRRRLAADAFAHTADYDRHIADFFAGVTHTGESPFPECLRRAWNLVGALRYGENPHQRAALYRDPSPGEGSLVGARQIHGKELSYNNYLDLQSALGLIREFPESAAAVVIKHNNPCGVAVGDSLAGATQRALEGDPVSAFGSILGLNRVVDGSTAELLCGPNLFVEAILAPGFTPEAVEALTTRPKWRQNVRLMELGNVQPMVPIWQIRQLDGGLLVQDSDGTGDDEPKWRVVTRREPTPTERRDLRMAWRVVRHVRSNAITVGNEETLRGVGAGQMSRVDSVRIALEKAGRFARGGSLASDAFFPFPDSIGLAAAAGIRAVVQPGGSKADPDVIAACDSADIAMIFTGSRHFSH